MTLEEFKLWVGALPPGTRVQILLGGAALARGVDLAFFVPKEKTSKWRNFMGVATREELLDKLGD